MDDFKLNNLTTTMQAPCLHSSLYPLKTHIINHRHEHTVPRMMFNIVMENNYENKKPLGIVQKLSFILRSKKIRSTLNGSCKTARLQSKRSQNSR